MSTSIIGPGSKKPFEPSPLSLLGHLTDTRMKQLAEGEQVGFKWGGMGTIFDISLSPQEDGNVNVDVSHAAAGSSTTAITSKHQGGPYPTEQQKRSLEAAIFHLCDFLRRSKPDIHRTVAQNLLRPCAEGAHL